MGTFIMKWNWAMAFRFSWMVIVATCLFFQSCSKDGGTGTEPDPVDPDKVEEPVDMEVIEVTELISAQQEQARLVYNWMPTDFSATGLYIPPTGTLKIKVELLAGSRAPVLLIGTYSRYGKWTSEPKSIVLNEGVNELKSSGEGLVWIRYTSDNTPDSKAKLTFSGSFKRVPYFKSGKTTNAQWQDMLLKYSDVPDVLLEGDRCYIVASRKNAVLYSDDDQALLVKKVSEVVDIQDDFSGLDGKSGQDMPLVHKKYLVTEHEDASLYFFAYHHRVAFINYDVSSILKVSHVIDGWGLWHELGHVHQQTWTWPSISEVSVNIYSLAVQRAFTPSVKRISHIWDSALSYVANTDPAKDFNVDKYFPGESVWIRLCMFEQLRLGLGETFWTDLLKKTRVDKPVFANDGQKMDYFIKSACVVANKDLSAFFKKWGLHTNSTVYTEVAALNLPKPTTDFSTLSDK